MCEKSSVKCVNPADGVCEIQYLVALVGVTLASRKVLYRKLITLRSFVRPDKQSHQLVSLFSDEKSSVEYVNHT